MCNSDVKLQGTLAAGRLEMVNFAQKNLNNTQQNLKHLYWRVRGKS